MLTTLKTYLSTRRAASLSEIARHVAADPEAVRAMLDHWIRKGRVRRNAGARCGGCASCAPADVEIYEWVGDRPADAAPPPMAGCGRR